MWILAAVCSALFAGLTSILAKCGIRKTDSDVATALRTVVVALFSWIMVAVVGSFSTITGISLADEEAKSISSGTHNGTVTRINGISESNDAAEMVIFNTQGIRTQKMQKGINIVKTQKGTRKVVKK